MRFLLPTTFSKGLQRALLLAGLLPGGLLAQAQAPAWQLATLAGQASNGFHTNVASAADASGNVYVVGNFSGTLSFGPVSITSASSFEDVFVAKWSSATNTFVWAQRMGGSDMDRATAVAVSGSNVYVAGVFGGGTATFGAVTLTNLAGATTGTNFDGFVAKLTDAGTSSSIAWAQQMGSTDFDYCQSLAVSNGNVYVAGWFNGPTAKFGPYQLTNASTNVVGRSDAFVAKLADAGNSGSVAWVQQLGAENDEFAMAVTAQGTSVYVAGIFNSTALTLGGTTLSSAGGAYTPADGFVAKLTDAGSTSTVAWAQRVGGTGADYLEKAVVSGSNLYLAGRFGSPTISFGSTTLTNTGPANSEEWFLAKMTDAGSTGSFAWAQQPGQPVSALAASSPAVYVASSTGNPLVAQYTDAGPSAALAWTQRENSGSAGAAALALSGTTVYVLGTASLPATFGTRTLTSATGSGSGAFLAALGSGPLAAAQGSRLVGSSLYPNPAHAAAAVYLPALASPAPAILSLTNTLGQEVRRQAVTLLATGTTLELPLLGLAPGLYQLRVQANGQVATHAVVVE
jgi:hypothetical protein